MQTTNHQTGKQAVFKNNIPIFLKTLNFIGPVAGIALAALPLALHFWSCQPQKLPISAIFKAKNQTIQLEVARREKELAYGLKFRSHIPQYHGMLFVINKPEEVKLWMKDTYVPLDMIFLKDGVVKNIVTNASPCHQECQKYSSIHPVNQVIELPAGSIKTLDLQVGKKIDLTFVK